jgi:uncharacterized protein involved in outer membrane biogenesis
MAKFFKFLSIVFLFVIVMLGAIFIFRDQVVKFTVSAGVRKITGLKLDIDSLSAGIPKTIISIQGMQLYNPKGYEDKLMVDIPEIYVDYDLAAILKNDIHLKEVRIDLREIVVVKQSNGEMNIDSLKVVKSAETEEAAVKKENQEKKKTNFRIDHLKLKIGRVLYKDYSAGSKPSIREYNINIDSSYENITDTQALVRLILVRALINTNISNLKIKNLQDLTASTLNMTVDELGGGIKKGIGSGQSLGEGVKDATDKTTETIKSLFNLGK